MRGGAPPGAGGGDLEAAHREAWGLVEELRRLNREMAEAWARRLNRTPLEDRPRQVQELRTSLAQLLAEKEAQPWPS
ncbi:hypothetical protein [Thermus sp.]|uniref:hypothetical protein n=1 Tax=Thermus sp. TaxID=275 RepID=UPI00298F2D21|nr:hypothetical protein [Thermus sp.]MDW8358847.1 hypothetical protein [Thermus sp.]